MTSRYFRRFLKLPGTAPGSLVYAGPERDHDIQLTRIAYDPKSYEEEEISPDQLRDAFRVEVGRVTWLDFDGVHDTEMVAAVAEGFDLHPLAAEDTLSLGQRPKLEEYDSGLHIALRMITFDHSAEQIRGEQVTLVLTGGALLSFQERPGDVFDPVRDRIRRGTGRIRRMGADYLMYALLDAIIDGYLVVVSELGDRVEALEEAILEGEQKGIPEQLGRMRKEAILMRRAMAPLREVLQALLTPDGDRARLGRWFKPETVPFLRDALDHLSQAIEAVDVIKEGLQSLADTYLNLHTLKANEIMVMLTLVASIFIPLTFLAGIYGMNFEYMPELAWPWAYPVLLGFMASIVVGMVVFFKRRGWL